MKKKIGSGLVVLFGMLLSFAFYRMKLPDYSSRTLPLCLCASICLIGLSGFIHGKKSDERYAGFWARFLSLVIDVAIYLAIQLTLQGIGHNYGPKGYLVFSFASVAVNYAIHILCLKRFGATPGKLLLRISVLRKDFGRIGFGEISKRIAVDFVLGVLYPIAVYLILKSNGDGIFPSRSIQSKYVLTHKTVFYNSISIASQIWLFSELVVILYNDKRRAIHDYIAGTVVVRNGKSTLN
jgi:uncharacterized RDD family membrane protein YckC